MDTKYTFTHPGECDFMPQRLMEAIYADILSRLRLDDPEKREQFLAMDRRDADKLIYKTYCDVSSHASPAIMRIVEREGQGDPNAWIGPFMERLVSNIYDSMKELETENGKDILGPAPKALDDLPCLEQVLSSAGFLQEIIEREWIEANSLRYLKVIGTINAYDFRYLRDDCPDLMMLDLTDALIVDYEGEEGTDPNITYYDSLEIPLGAFCYGKYRNGKAGHQSLNIILFHEDTYMIQRGAFMGCSKLTNVFLPDKMEILDEKAFMSCESLEYVYLGGTRLIKNGAFNGCRNLKDIVCPGNPPMLGNPNQSPDMRRFATPIFTPHESVELGPGMNIRAVEVPEDKISTYEKTDWKDVSPILSGEFHGRDLFETNLEIQIEWMAERDGRMAMWDIITAAVCNDDGSFSDSAQETIMGLLRDSLILDHEDFHHVLQNSDLERSAKVLGKMNEDELKKFFQELHSAITKEGINDERIRIMYQALSSFDIDKYEDLLGDAMETYFPSPSEGTDEKGNVDEKGEIEETLADETEEENDTPMTGEEILQALEEDPDAKDIHDFIERDSISSKLAWNFILKEEPKSAADLKALLDRVRDQFMTVPGSKPSVNDIEIRKAKIGMILLAAVADGNMNDKEKEAVNQIINSFEYRVPDPDYAAIFDEYKGEKAIDVLMTAKYGERLRLVNSIDYVFNVDGPLNQKETDLMLILLHRLEIQPKDTDLDLDAYGLGQTDHQALEEEGQPAGQENTEDVNETEEEIELSADEEIKVEEQPVKEAPGAAAEGWACPACGHTGNQGKFCSECGTKKKNQEEATPIAIDSGVSAKDASSSSASIPAPQVSAAAEDTSTQIHAKRKAKIWYCFDQQYVDLGGKRGARFQTRIEVSNCMDIECKCLAWLFNANGYPVMDKNGLFRASNGQACASVSFKPTDNHANIDLQIDFPYEEFHIKGENVPCYVTLQVYCLDSKEFISPVFNHSFHFTYWQKSDYPAFKDIQYDDYDSKELRITVKFADNPPVKTPGEVRVWFHHKDGTTRYAYDKHYRDTNNHHCVSVNRRFTSDPGSLLSNGIILSIPYSALHLTFSSTWELKFKVGIHFNGAEEWLLSDLVSFKVEVSKGLLSTKYRLIK